MKINTCSASIPQVRLWDFGGMDQHHRSFRSITPLDGTVINNISHSPDGKRFVVAPAASQLMARTCVVLSGCL
jgi:hypothetical protein